MFWGSGVLGKCMRNAFINTLTGIILVIAGNLHAGEPLFDSCNDADIACEAPDIPSTSWGQSCPHSEKTLNFSTQSLEAGLDYFRSHPAPLALLLPRVAMQKNSRGRTVISEYYQPPQKKAQPLISHAQKLMNAQKMILSWFDDDQRRGKTRPVITRERFYRIFQAIVDGYPAYTYPVDERLQKQTVHKAEPDRLTPDVIDETLSVLSRLHKEAKTKHQQFSYIVVCPLKKQVNGVQADYLPLNATLVKKGLKDRKEFLETLSSNTDRYSIESSCNRGGFCQTMEDFSLQQTDYARFYHIAISEHGAGHDFSRYKTSEVSESHSDDVFKYFDVPPNISKGVNVRKWKTFMPLSDPLGTIAVPPLALISSSQRGDIFKMFEIAISHLQRGLKPEMQATQLYDLLAKAWQELEIIHVLPEGNGRVVRLLINSILMAYGQPPVTCNPDCLPIFQIRKDVKSGLCQSMQRSVDTSESDYPEWITRPVQPALRNFIAQVRTVKLSD